MCSANPLDTAGYQPVEKLSQVVVDKGSTSVKLLKKQQNDA
uniref:Bm10968 n=1 Tax=Brugia malayi TaxID=6279 RepID=A0A1I9G590_BRUMA|nr:Bm10968 [Brugia malayi]